MVNINADELLRMTLQTSLNNYLVSKRSTEWADLMRYIMLMLWTGGVIVMALDSQLKDLTSGRSAFT